MSEICLCFIHPFLYRYARGIERYTVNLASALVNQGIQVDILTWRWQNAIQWQELNPHVNVVTFPSPRYYTATWMALAYATHLYRHAYDRVFINFADYGEAGAFNNLHRLSIMQPFSIVLHYPNSQVPHRYDTFVNRKLSSQAKEIIAVSRFVALGAEDRFQRECQVIGHGVDTRRFKPDSDVRFLVRQELGIHPDAPMLLTVSALEARKGIAWVLAALPDLLKIYPDLTYLVIGDGPQFEQLTGLIDQLGISNRVRMLPASPQVARYYQAADLMIILAHGEASSLVSLEAMACQVPVVCSNNPPFDELIQSEWGVQVDATNTSSVIDSIGALLNDSPRRQKMGLAGRLRILKMHTWEKVSQQYLDLISF